MNPPFLFLLSSFLVVLFSGYGFASPIQIQTRIQPRASTNNLILTSSSINGFKTSIGNFGGAKVDPSSLTLSIGGKDVTSITSITPSRGASYNEVYDGFIFETKLTDPLKAQANLEIKLSGLTKDGISFESKTVAGVVAKFVIAPIHIIKIPSYDSVLEDATIATPVSVFEHGAVNILYQEGDKLENFIVNVPVFALDEKGQPVLTNATNLSLTGLSSGVTSGTVNMTAGLAVVPLTIASSNPETLKLEVATVSIDTGTRSATRVSTRILPLLVIPVVVITAEELFAITVGLAVAAKELLAPSPPQQPFADWVGTQESFGDLSYPVTQFPPVIGGSCAPRPFSFPGILANSGNEPIDVPLKITISPNFKVFGDCRNQLLNWIPPAKGSDKYNEIKNRIENKVDGDGKSIFDSGSTGSAGRAELSKMEREFAPQDYATNGRKNRIQEVISQIAENIANKAEKILTEVRWKEIIVLTGSRDGNPSSGLYGHLNRLRELGKSAAKFLKNYSYAASSGKNSAKICFTPDELDVLSVLQDIIEEVLDQYNNWNP